MSRPLHVLIVEDSPDDADRLLRELSRGSFAPVGRRVTTETELRDALRHGGWDVVLADNALPGFGARTALALTRQADANLPFIVVTGTAGDEVAAEMMRAGASDYILKDSLGRLAVSVERELREAENRRARQRAERTAFQLAAVVQSSADPIISETLDGTITSWNPAAERLFGWTEAEAIGQPSTVLVPADRGGELAARKQRLQRGEAVAPFETVQLHKSGARVDVAVVLSPLRVSDGELVGFSTVARDITEKKRAEEAARRYEAALRRSEERHRLLVESMPHLVWMARPDGMGDYLSQRGIERLGIPADAASGRGWVQLLHPDDVGPSHGSWEEAVRTGTAYRREFRVRHGDGTYHWYLSQAVPLERPDGTIERWVGTLTDIDPLKQTEAERDRLLAQLRVQIERMPVGYLLSDADLCYTAWNPAAERMFGYAEAEVLGKHPFELIVPPQSQAAVRRIFDRLKAGDMNAHGSSENITRDGRLITCEWYNTPLMDAGGEFVGLLSLAQDVTARRSAEAELRLRDRAIQAVTQGILITDPSQRDNPIVYASPSFLRMTGYTADAVLGRNARFLQGKETDPAAVAQVRAAVAEGRPCTVELLNYCRDGTPFWIELSIAPIRDDDGRLTHFVGTQTDVTQRRRLEEQYRQSQKMEAIGQLAGGVAHDFNNLLTIITGYSDLLLQTQRRDDPTRELLEEIRKAGERSASLTRQLLAFSRKTVLAPKVLDLNEVVLDTEKMLRRVIGEDVHLAAVLHPRVGRIKADPGQIEQVLINLAVNARDAMPQGGKLLIETNNVELDEEHARANPRVRPGRYVLLTVTDSGVGMTAEVKRHIFEPFFTTKRAGQGTGLGLAVVHGVVEQSEGHIEVESESGKGASFRIYLPRVELPMRSGRSAHGLTPAPRGTETILVVEDEEAVRALTRHVLLNCGYRVCEAGDGDAALQIAAKHTDPIHLLVTDVVMPGAGGRVLAEGVCALHPETKVLYVSGYTDDAIVRHGISHEEVEFLQKPFSPLALAHKVREVLDK